MYFIIKFFNLKKSIKEFSKIIISDILDYKPLLFDHLPKCGGSTIGNFLARAYPEAYSFIISGNAPHDSISIFKNLDKQKRHRFKLIYGHLASELFDFIHPSMMKTVVFREPIDRIISHYFYVKENEGHYLNEKIILNDIQLADYCHNQLSDELENWYVKYFSGWSNDLIERHPDEAIYKAFSNIVYRYDVIGFQDKINDFISDVKFKSKIKNKFAGEFINKTKHRLSIEKIESEVLVRISDKNKMDIELFHQLKNLFYK